MSGCELTGKRTMSGNNVSHSERKTRRKFKVNIQKKGFLSERLQSEFTFKVCAHVIKTIDKVGGLDSYLLKTSNDLLSVKAKNVKYQIKAKSAV
jgi:large subunit ribosomal protein L28